VIDGGKAGVLIELDAQTGKLLWQRPVGGHDGHENDGLLTEHAMPSSGTRCQRRSASSRAFMAAS
jgi:outer membrane protein assembly factor BamB